MTLLFNQLGLPENARALATLIHDFDDSLFLERLPDQHPWLVENPDKPFAVIHRPLGAPEYIFGSYPGHLLDHRVFADILAGYAGTHKWDLSEFDPVTAAHHLLEGRKRADEWEAENDRRRFNMEASGFIKKKRTLI